MFCWFYVGVAELLGLIVMFVLLLMGGVFDACVWIWMLNCLRVGGG